MTSKGATRIVWSFPVVASGICLATLVVALVVQGGHPPLADSIAVIAVPLAWLIDLIGGAAIFLLRRALPKRQRNLALAGNAAVIVAGLGLWLLWPLLRSG